MHRTRVLLTRVSKTIIAAESSSTTKAANVASSKATLPAAANTTTTSTTASVVAANEPPPPRNGDDNPPLPDTTTTTTTIITTETSTSSINSTTTTTTKTTTPPYIIPLYHHVQPNLFPTLRPGTLSYFAHHISSSMSAAYNLCTSQESRDQFMSVTNPSTSTINDDDDDDITEASVAGTGEQQQANPIIINTSVLGQSDVGLLKSLTLYHELCHPSFYLDESHSNHINNSKNDNSDNTNHNHAKINVKEFVMGCGWALEQFHRTKEEVLIKWLQLDIMEKVNNPTMDEKNEEVDDPSSSSSSSTGFYQDFIHAASQDSTSLEYDFIKMTTPEIFMTLQMEGIMRMLLMQGEGGMSTRGGSPTADTNTTTTLLKIEDIKVMNVALLSARVQDIYPPPTLSMPSASLEGETTKKKANVNSDSVDAPLEDDSLMPQQPTDEATKAQVVTQLEVLYELQQSSFIEKDAIDGNNESTAIRTKTSVMVGKFEACIDGDPNCHQQGDGNDKDIGNLRWKLASYRPALEFYNTF